MKETVVASAGSRKCSTSGSPIAPRAIEKAVIPSWTVPMKRTGSSMIRRAILARRLPSAASSDRRVRLAVTSAVLGRNEERVPRDEQENGEDLEENGHAPLPGAWVLGGISSNF